MTLLATYSKQDLGTDVSYSEDGLTQYNVQTVIV